MSSSHLNPTRGRNPVSIDPVHYARRWKTLAVLAVSLAIIGLDNTILNVALPSLQEEFDASSSTLQWMVDAYLLVFAALLLTMGTLGDRFGRKLALQTGLVLFGGASLCVLLVETSGQLIAVRAVMGVGGAMIMPATLSIISNVFPREERKKAIAIWAAMASIGVGLGPLFGGLLLEWFDWTSVFLLNVPVAAAALLAGFRLVPESRDPKPGAFDLVGVGLSIVALVSLVYGIIDAPESGWTSPTVLGCFGLAVVFGAAFVAWELRVKDPMLNLSFFRDPRFSVASLGISLSSFAMFGAIFALTQFLQDAHGYSALEAGAAMSPIAIGLVVGAGSSVKLQGQVGTTPVVTAGLLGLGTTLSTSLLWSHEMAYWPLAIWFFALAMFMGWIMGPATGSVMSAVPEEKSGVASAMNDVTRQVAGALGTAVIGSLITSLYASRVGDSTGSLPESARAAAEDSIGQAQGIAANLPVAEGARLADSASVAFTDALGIGFAVAAAFAILAAVVVKRRLPNDRVAAQPDAVVDTPAAVLVEGQAA
jgi:MFS transporter, DHA2 family, multidrug resistance protein